MAVCAKVGCNKPVFIDSRTGIAHDFCGRTHALEQCRGAVKRPHGICHMCRLPGCEETVYFDEDSGRVHDFCSLSHAQEAIKNKNWPKSLKGEQVGGGGAAAAATLCSLPGCTAPRWRDPETQEVKDFCGRTHAIKAKERGLVGRSRALEDAVEHVWPTVSQDSEESGSVAMMTRFHPKYEKVKKQFLEAWRHPDKQKPSIMRIYQVSTLTVCVRTPGSTKQTIRCWLPCPRGI
jgi:hypothetical protein